MSLDFQLDGVYEHRVQTDVVFNLKVRQNGEPADANFPVEAWLKGITENVRGTVTYTKGNYHITFFPGLVGKYELHIKVKDNWLYKDSDAVVNIADKFSTHYVDLVFEVGGPGIIGGQVGKTTHISFVSKGPDGEFVDPEDLDELSVRIGSGPSLIKVRPTRINKGNFKAEFEVPTPGYYNVDLWYQDKTVLKETIRAHFTTPSSAKNTKATNVPKGFVTVGQVASFVIQARNQNDLNSTTGGDEFEVSCNGPCKITDLVIRDSLDGKYNVLFTPIESGVYEFHISLNKQPIGNSPVSVSATRR